MRTVVPCNENRFFLVRIDSQGVPCKPYRVWVSSVEQVTVTAPICWLCGRHFGILACQQFMVVKN